MIQIESVVPAIVSMSDGTLALMVGGVVATMQGPGPFSGGVRVRFSVTAEVGALSEGAEPTAGDLALTELAFACDPPRTGEARAAVGRYVAVLGHHIASFLLNEAMPAVPVTSLRLPSELSFSGAAAPTGVLEGTHLGHVAPSFAVVDGHLEASGAFGEIPGR